MIQHRTRSRKQLGSAKVDRTFDKHNCINRNKDEELDNWKANREAFHDTRKDDFERDQIENQTEE